MALHKSRGRPSGSGGQAHHISNIAHHFFAEDDPIVHDTPGLQDCGHVVTAADSGLASALATAGLATASLGPSQEPAAGPADLKRPRPSGAIRPVYVRESPRQHWSVHSFLKSQDIVSDRQTESFGPNVWGESRPFLPSDTHAWQVHMSQAPPMSQAMPGAGSVQWLNLGRVGSETLELWEGLRLKHEGAPGPEPGLHGLVWCLFLSEVQLWGSTYQLGRLLEILRPQTLELVVFDDVWRQFGRPGWTQTTAKQRGPTAAALEGLLSAGRQRVESLWPDQQFNLTWAGAEPMPDTTASSVGWADIVVQRLNR